jgi:hypothetical protein
MSLATLGMTAFLASHDDAQTYRAGSLTKAILLSPALEASASISAT